MGIEPASFLTKKSQAKAMGKIRNPSQAQTEAMKLLNRTKAKRKSSTGSSSSPKRSSFPDNNKSRTSESSQDSFSAEDEIDNLSLAKAKDNSKINTNALKTDASLGIDEPSLFLNDTEDDKKRFFEQMGGSGLSFKQLLDNQESSDDDREDLDNLDVKTTEWLNVLEKSQHSDIKASGNHLQMVESVPVGSPAALEKSEAEIPQSDKSDLKEVPKPAPAKNNSDLHIEYSLSFESVTDIRNQKFQANPSFESESLLSKKPAETHTFEDSISSISMDEHPSQSFMKNEGNDYGRVDSEENSSPKNHQSINKLEEQNDHVEHFSEQLKHPIQSSIPEKPVKIIASTSALVSAGEQKSISFADLLKMNDEAVKPEADSTPAISTSPKKTRPITKQKFVAAPKQKTVQNPPNKKKAILSKTNAKIKTVARPLSVDSGKKEFGLVASSEKTLDSSPLKTDESEKNANPVEAATYISPTHSLLEMQLELLRRENATLLARAASLETDNISLNTVLAGTKSEINILTQEVYSLQEQLRFQEGLLQEERESKSSDVFLDKDKDPQFDALQKKLDDQEYLIQGYQKENEKLVLQNKEVKKTAKESEQRHFLKLEAAQKDVAILKTQLELTENSVLKNGTSMTSAKTALNIENLTNELSKCKHDLEIQAEDSKRQIDKYEALLAEANKQAIEAISKNPDHIKKMVSEFEKAKVEREKYILEVETKLEWHIGNQDIFNTVQKRIERYEKTINDLNKALDSQPNSEFIKRAPNDVRRIKQLENQIIDLQEQFSSNTKPPVELGIEMQRPDIPLQQVVVYLKSIIFDIETAHGKSKTELEDTIKSLNEKLLQLSTTNIPQPAALVTRPNLYITSEKENLAPGKKNEDLNDVSSISSLLKRITNFEKIEAQSSLKLKERDELLQVWEEKYKILEKKLRPETTRLSGVVNPELDSVRAELQVRLSEIASLRLKLQLAEESQQTLHQTTLELMKSSQQQASQVAFEHSKHSIELLRAELEREHGFQTKTIIDSYKTRIFDLETRLASIPVDPDHQFISELQDKVNDLERENSRISKMYKNCEERLNRTKDGIPPSLSELNRLAQRIQDLELMGRERELMLKTALEKQTGRIEVENQRLQRELRIREQQIKRFQVEMTGILAGIAQLKNNKF